ncbi:MAG: hypothetical protein E7163_02450 [Firmicutes bacterium]|nr:hypothetical protein [Bacillota bacterium]
MDKLLLQVITDKEIINKKSLKEVIAERKLIKTKLKLIQIFYLDQDLIELNKYNLGINNFNLDNIFLTENLGLYVPLKNKIVNKDENDKTKLNSYLLYLSYLYNFDFLDLFLNKPGVFYQLICELNISERIKDNILRLTVDLPAEHFSKNIEDLNNAKFRENLIEDELKLQRLKKM